ncbi:uncharacterized protein LOC144103418 [Amblyomma americanum]
MDQRGNHVLCESCYELSAQGDHACVCPLDRLQCLDEDVGFQEMAADELLKIKVRCWNEQAGCDAIMPASELSDHFHNECGYHSASCSKCSASVLCADIYPHLISDCSGSVLSASLSYQRGSDNRGETVGSEALMKLLDQRMADIKAGLEQILNDHVVQNQTLSEVQSCVEALNEGPWTVFAETSSQRRKSSISSVADPAGTVEMEVGESSNQPSRELKEVSGRMHKLQQTFRHELQSAMGRIRGDIAQNTAKIMMTHSEFIKSSQAVLSCLETVIAETSLERTLPIPSGRNRTSVGHFCKLRVIPIFRQRRLPERLLYVIRSLPPGTWGNGVAASLHRCAQGRTRRISRMAYANGCKVQCHTP